MLSLAAMLLAKKQTHDLAAQQRRANFAEKLSLYHPHLSLLTKAPLCQTGNLTTTAADQQHHSNALYTKHPSGNAVWPVSSVMNDVRTIYRRKLEARQSIIMFRKPCTWIQKCLILNLRRGVKFLSHDSILLVLTELLLSTDMEPQSRPVHHMMIGIQRICIWMILKNTDI